MNDNSLERELGKISATLDNIQKYQEESAASRRLIHEKLHQADLRMQKIETGAQFAAQATADLKSDVEALQPLATKIKEWEVKGITVIGAAAFVGGLIVTVLGFFKEKIFHALGF